MFEKLQDLVHRSEELEQRLNDPSVIADQTLWQKTVREHAALQPITEAYGAYRRLREELEQNRLLLEEEEDGEKNERVRGIPGFDNDAVNFTAGILSSSLAMLLTTLVS